MPAKSKYFDARKGAKRRGKARKGAGNLAEQKVTEGSEDFVLRKVFTLDYSGRDMKSQWSLLKYGYIPEIKSCVSPQVFYGSRRKARCVFGSESLPDNVANLGVSIRGSARIE